METAIYTRFELQYTLQSPMRVGHRKVGNLQTTKSYVPGLAMWGSTVNRLVALLPRPQNAPKGNPYLYWGEILKEYCRFSCLCFQDPETDETLYPARPENRRRLEDLFITSTVHTPINHALNIREEGMLHELEWIEPVSEGGKPVRLRGWLDVNVAAMRENGLIADDSATGAEIGFIAEGEQVSLREIMARATIGADLNKGCGRLALTGDALSAEDNIPAGEEPRPLDGGDDSGRYFLPGPLLAAETGPAHGPMESVAGRCHLPLDGAEKPAVAGKYLYHYLAYLPGVMVMEKKSYRMNWFGCYKEEHAS